MPADQVSRAVQEGGSANRLDQCAHNASRKRIYSPQPALASCPALAETLAMLSSSQTRWHVPLKRCVCAATCSAREWLRRTRSAHTRTHQRPLMRSVMSMGFCAWCGCWSPLYTCTHAGTLSILASQTLRGGSNTARHRPRTAPV